MNPNLAPSSEIVYPESDGKPMSDNPKQFRWITTLAGNLASLFRDREDVFVCGDQLWYPVEGEPTIRAAPDVYVVFGRPKGDRGSYKQWEEDDTPMTVVFEILSPSNTAQEMTDKFHFYDDYGVEEYYIYNPDNNVLQGFCRQGETLVAQRPIHDHVSPRLGIRFDTSGEELVVYHPDGRPFLTREQYDDEVERVVGAIQSERDEAKRRAERADERAEQAERERDEAAQRTEQVQQERDEAAWKLARIAELTPKAISQQATPEELEELQRLLS